jgi:hypothetical protein
MAITDIKLGCTGCLAAIELGQYYEGTSFKYPGEITLLTKEGKQGIQQ